MNTDVIIISYYDSGVYWSVLIGDKIYERDPCDWDMTETADWKTVYSVMEDLRLTEIIDYFSKQCNKIIFCHNGSIAIYEKGVFVK